MLNVHTKSERSVVIETTCLFRRLYKEKPANIKGKLNALVIKFVCLTILFSIFLQSVLGGNRTGDTLDASVCDKGI